MFARKIEYSYVSEIVPNNRFLLLSETENKGEGDLKHHCYKIIFSCLQWYIWFHLCAVLKYIMIIGRISIIKSYIWI